MNVGAKIIHIHRNVLRTHPDVTAEEVANLSVCRIRWPFDHHRERSEGLKKLLT